MRSTQGDQSQTGCQRVRHPDIVRFGGQRIDNLAVAHDGHQPGAGRAAKAATGRKNRRRAPVERRGGRLQAREPAPPRRDLSPTAASHGWAGSRRPNRAGNQCRARTYPTAAAGVRRRGRSAPPAARPSRRVHPADPASPASRARCRPAGTRRRFGRRPSTRRDGRTVAPPRAGAPPRAPHVGPPAVRAAVPGFGLGGHAPPPCQRRPGDAIPEVRGMRLVRV